MPILSLDHNGRLMESNPDRHDGKGYKGPVARTLAGDNTLGNAISSAQDAIETSNAQLNKALAIRDHYHSRAIESRKAALRQKRRAQFMGDRRRQTQWVQDAMIEEGADQYARGQDQASYAEEQIPVIAVDPIELKRQILQSTVFSNLCVEANNNAQNASYDASNAKLNTPQASDPMKMATANPNVVATPVVTMPVVATNAYVHPMAKFFGK